MSRGRSAALLGLAVAAALAVILTLVLAGPASHKGGPPTSGSGSAGSSAARTSAAGGAGPQAGVIHTATAPACDGPARAVNQPLAGVRTTDRQFDQPAPPDATTYDLTGVTLTGYPSTRSILAVGSSRAGLQTCVLGGVVQGRTDPAQTWNYYHDQFNAACVKIIAREWMQVRGLRCDSVEDGIRPEESGVNANNTEFFVSGTYLSHIRDDCMENDYTVGGVLADSLWEQCNTGLSERPAGGRSWTTPAAETVTLDHMLIGLYQTPHDKGGRRVTGENALFKWSSSGNHVVIKCSMFMVDAVSLNGADAMAFPPGTVVDDSACPNNPTTIVWLGKGPYPAPHGVVRVVTDRAVWDDAVRAWKAAHGY